MDDADSQSPEDELDAQVERALALACAQINRRERTVAEVSMALERRGVPERAARRAIRALTEQGMLDDERFAAVFAADKRELEQWGRERILRGLLARGVERHLSEAVAAGHDSGVGASEIDGVAGREAELERALAVLRQRFPEPPRQRRDRDRALGVLLRKGYESELALDALDAHVRAAE